jgi:hypothetical protein
MKSSGMPQGLIRTELRIWILPEHKHFIPYTMEFFVWNSWLKGADVQNEGEIIYT